MAELRVEIVYALAESQTVVRLSLAPGTTVEEAVARSGLLDALDAGAVPRYGIFGQQVTPQRPLRDGDRVEIYRPLIADARAVRRARVTRRRR